MSDYLADKVTAPFSATGAGTTTGVTVTQAAPTVAMDKYVVYGVQYSGDAAAIVTIESPASTILWRKQYAAAFNESVPFTVGIHAAEGQAVLVKISASAAFCQANIQGVRI